MAKAGMINAPNWARSNYKSIEKSDILNNAFTSYSTNSKSGGVIIPAVPS